MFSQVMVSQVIVSQVMVSQVMVSQVMVTVRSTSVLVALKGGRLTTSNSRVVAIAVASPLLAR